MSHEVLVLNNDYEPLNVCNLRRAIVLVFLGKAEILHTNDGTINMLQGTIDSPSVVKLRHHVKRPLPELRLSRRSIFARDNYTCQYCGQHYSYLTLDHIVPRRLGGQHTWDNLVAACPTCNHHKGGRTLEQAQMRLLHLPTEPLASAQYLFAPHLVENEEWLPFVEGW